MAMRLYWPIGLTRDMPGRTQEAGLLETHLNAYAKHVVSPDTTVTIGWMKKTTSLLSSIYLGMVNDVYVINDILAAQREGFDAATVGGHWDPGLFAAREAASIPVTGPGEAAMMIAQTLGRRFAMLTVHEGYVPIIERNILNYGCQPRAISRNPVRKFGMTYENLVTCLRGESDEFLTAFTHSAKECIADGADVIIAGGQLFGPIFTKYNYTEVPNTGVPVVEVTACALKLAEALVGLRRQIGLRKSEHYNAPFRTPPAEVLDTARKTFNLDT